VSKPTVWKYELAFEDEQVLTMPAGATPISVAIQGPRLCLWALVDAQAQGLTNIYVRILGTGGPAVEDIADWNFIGTVLIDGGVFVFHVFWRGG
jgi:hypothetical protein